MFFGGRRYGNDFRLPGNVRCCSTTSESDACVRSKRAMFSNLPLPPPIHQVPPPKRKRTLPHYVLFTTTARYNAPPCERRRKGTFVLYNCTGDEYVLLLPRDDFLCWEKEATAPFPFPGIFFISRFVRSSLTYLSHCKAHFGYTIRRQFCVCLIKEQRPNMLSIRFFCVSTLNSTFLTFCLLCLFSLITSHVLLMQNCVILFFY